MARRKTTEEDKEWIQSQKATESKPTSPDEAAAKREWNDKNPDVPWELLRTQKKNRLIEDQKFHREFRELSNAIRNFR